MLSRAGHILEMGRRWGRKKAGDETGGGGGRRGKFNSVQSHQSSDLCSGEHTHTGSPLPLFWVVSAIKY